MNKKVYILIGLIILIIIGGIIFYYKNMSSESVVNLPLKTVNQDVNPLSLTSTYITSSELQINISSQTSTLIQENITTTEPREEVTEHNLQKTEGIESEFVNWENRLKNCIDEHSFLKPILAELEKYKNMKSKSLNAVIEVSETSRGCITLPEDIYPRSERSFGNEGNASLSYVSNWEDSCGVIFWGPVGDNCTGNGYEAAGSGEVLFQAKSSRSGVPDINVMFIITQ